MKIPTRIDIKGICIGRFYANPLNRKTLLHNLIYTGESDISLYAKDWDGKEFGVNVVSQIGFDGSVSSRFKVL